MAAVGATSGLNRTSEASTVTRSPSSGVGNSHAVERCESPPFALLDEGTNRQGIYNFHPDANDPDPAERY
jgi:hypothetical protein